MSEARRQFSIGIGVLLLLGGLLLWVQAVDTRRARKAEARRLVTAAMKVPDLGSATALFRQASAFDAAYSACKEGRQLEARGRFAAAADQFRACRDADPELPAVHLAWAQSLLRSEGDAVYPEVRAHLVDLLEAKPGRFADPESLKSVRDLTVDLEELMAVATPPQRREVWTVGELVDALSRETRRGASRYEGPRVPLRLGFRPGDSDLGAAAESQLREVAKALGTSRLAGALFEIEGHTDGAEAATEEERRALGLRRAREVRDFLVLCGIPAQRLRVKSLGGRYPLDSNATLSGRDANRRVELFNLDEGAPVWRDAREAQR